MRDLDPDYAALLCLEVLPEDERATVAAWLDRLGMDAEDLAAVPPLRVLVGMMAALIRMSEMDPSELTRSERFARAGDALGLRGDTLLRTWYRWQDAAVRQFVRPEDPAA